MQTLMIPLSEITSPRMTAVNSPSGFIGLQIDAKYALNAITKCPRLSIIAEGYSGRALSAHRPTHLVTRCTQRTTLLSLDLPRPYNSNPYSAKPARGGRGRADVRAGFGSSIGSPFSSTRGRGSTSNVSATGTAAAASPDNSEAEDPEKASPRQNFRVLSSVSENTSGGEDGEEGRVQKTTTILQSGGQEDGEEGRVQKSTTILQSGGQEDGEEGRVQKTTTILQSDEQETGRGSEPLALTEEEYKLTEEGTLSRVTVTRGGVTHRTDTEVARVLAEVGIQAESLQTKIRNFSVRKFIQEWGKKKPGVEDLKFNAAMYDPTQGVTNITQWTATELTLQRAQLQRISTDALYLVWAFSFFGGVRILETLVTVFSTSPPNFKRLMDAMNAMDPLTVASLAHAVRQPIVGLLKVEPTNVEQVSSLKVKFLSELHKFYERQWKVIATLGLARFFTLIVTHLPSAAWATSKLKVAWDITMALPIF